MSLKVSTLVWLTLAFKGSDLLVMLALADWCDDEGGRLFPAMAAIAKKARLSKAQARRVVRALIAEGWLAVEANAAGGAPGTTPQYRINVERLERTACADASRTASTSATPTANAGARDGSHGRTDTAGAGASLNGYGTVKNLPRTWWMNEKSATAMAATVGIKARAGESLGEFSSRISAALSNRRQGRKRVAQ